MKIYLHNTLSREKEEFVPIDPKNVRIYFCGPTVYNLAHMGNARSAMIFDLLARFFRYVYGKDSVQYSSNITDIDDKIIEAARSAEQDISDITNKYEKIYNDDMAGMGINLPDIQPHATECIEPMLGMIAKLIEKGHAYEAESHVLFDVNSWDDYGKLSRLNRDAIIAGARVEIAPYKRDSADFILWKPSSEDQPGWDSPYGRGRPGWHLECSAMNEEVNGNHFDIHGGGADLIFPHHENEIAQSECAHDGEKYVNYWMHVGYVTSEGQKMAKSVGNVVLPHDLIKEHNSDVLRFALLSAHYRQPFDWSENLVQQSKATLDRYYNILLKVNDIEIDDSVEAPKEFLEALADDLNTPKAMSEIAKIAKQLSIADNDTDKARLKTELLRAGELMGFLTEYPEAWFKGSSSNDESVTIDVKVEELQKARESKDYVTADSIRAELKEKYLVEISITADGITWRKM